MRQGGIGRRGFLAAALGAGLTAYGAERLETSRARVDDLIRARGGAAARTGGRPNVLIITTDQQWAGAMSCAGNPYLNTPAMDSLACNGVMFESAYTANPVCVAARTSYMTGTFSHENGVVTNVRENQVPVTVPCLAKVFRDHGYDTGYVGKWHLPRPLEDREWSGFDFIAAPPETKGDFNFPAPCAEFMLKERENPFLLVASFVNPHDICQWARRHSGMEDDLPNGEIGPPPPPDRCPSLRANHAIPAGEPTAVRIHQADPNMRHAYVTRDWPEGDDRWRQFLWGYYRMTELVDAYIGQVLDALRATGQEENTVVVFTSDHGDGMGSHRWNQKTIFYDEVSRIPFIVSWKGRTKPCGRNRSHLVNMGTDLFPTLFDFAGIEKPAGLHGVSAAPAAMGRAEGSAREFIVVENNHHSGVGNPTDTHGRMVRSARYKYIRYSTGEKTEQMFDLELDPGETRDLTLDPAAAGVLDAHRAMLNRHIDETNDWFPRWTAA